MGRRKRSYVLCCAKLLQSCPTICNHLGSSVLGILQARILERVAFPSPEDLPDPRIEPASPALQADSLPGKLIKPRHSRDLKASTLQPNIKKTANPI